MTSVGIGNPRSRLWRIPKGFRPKAQGCAERATLGWVAKRIQPQRGCGTSASAYRLRATCNQTVPINPPRPNFLPLPGESAGVRAGVITNLSLVFLCLFLTGCRRDMFQQPRDNPLSASDFFPNGAGSRPLVPNTVARGHLDENVVFYTGKVGTNLVEGFPIAVTPELLERGRERYEIYCSVCHGRTGDGRGMIVQRGFPQPPSYHIDRLRQAPAGYFYNVITQGYGVMYSYAARVEPEDRWAITAYIRALQLSQNAQIADVPSNQRAKLKAQSQ